jgi:hypothetical protein
MGSGQLLIPPCPEFFYDFGRFTGSASTCGWWRKWCAWDLVALGEVAIPKPLEISSDSDVAYLLRAFVLALCLNDDDTSGMEDFPGFGGKAVDCWLLGLTASLEVIQYPDLKP